MMNKCPRNNDPTQQQSFQSKFHIGSYINNANSLKKSQVSGYGFWTKLFMVCISQQYGFKIQGRIQDFRLE